MRIIILGNILKPSSQEHRVTSHCLHVFLVASFFFFEFEATKLQHEATKFEIDRSVKSRHGDYSVMRIKLVALKF